MKEKRPSLPDDQEKCEYAFQLVQNLFVEHPEVEPTLWAGALWSSIVHGYKNSDFTYEEFCQEVCDALKHYKDGYEA